MSPSNRLTLAVGVSLLAHSLILALPARKLGETLVSRAPTPMTVVIVPPELPKAEEAAPPPPAAETPPAPIQPPRREPRPPPRPRPPEPRPTLPEPPPAVAEAVPPRTEPPAVDMLAMIEQRRAQRRAEDARRTPAVPVPDAATRNLQTLTGREGVSGVFQILRMGTRSGEFSFNGWRPSAYSRWRQVIEVEAKPGETIELAMVRRMIALIRSHYTGDFNWESHRLGRVVVLSARPEDNEGLEDFLMREFFGQPMVNPRR